jgi:thiol-disulfide isomerase/thioredoxin
MMELGTISPDFRLLDTVNDQFKSLENLRGEKGTVVMFICNHCPYVLHVNEELVRIANDYRVTGFGFIAISSNDVIKYPQDSPNLMRQTAYQNNYSFPYLYDESQEVARAYGATCTPDLFLFDAQQKLVYRGQLDDSRPGNGIPQSGRSLREAMDALLGNKKVTASQKPSMGCGIKWKT